MIAYLRCVRENRFLRFAYALIFYGTICGIPSLMAGWWFWVAIDTMLILVGLFMLYYMDWGKLTVWAYHLTRRHLKHRKDSVSPRLVERMAWGGYCTMVGMFAAIYASPHRQKILEPFATY